MRFEVLGPLRVVADGTAPLTVPAPRQRVLLATLLWRANRPLSVDELAEFVWDGRPPPGAQGTVRAYVMRLRHVLGERVGGRIVTREPGYAIELAEDESDVLRFEALSRDADAAVTAGEWARVASATADALALWRGTPLADVPCQALRDRWVPHLDESRLQLLASRIEADLRLGRHERVIADLRDLTARHPLRERFHEQLMTALARSGRQAEALAAYQDARRRLVDELGIEPGPELRRLHARVLAGDAEPAAPPAPMVPRQLPAAVRHFTGRVGELKALSGLLSQSAASAGAVVISAIDGTAGVGKTALAVHWAHQHADRFPDGQLYVNLRGFDPSGEPVPVASAVRGFLDALGLPRDSVPADTEAQLALYRSRLAGRRVLVVLDNARDEEQARPLLPGASGCLVLITSRNKLGGLVAVDGAMPLTLDLLTAQEARDLLARRLGVERVIRESRAVDELIELCARLPLALNVAAARAVLAPRGPVADLVAELRDARRRLSTLALGAGPADVRAVFSWSYRALDPAAARMFRLLGLHPGPDVGVPAAADLAAIGPERARRLLDDLTAAHLLAEHAPGRYTFHDLLRAYAAEQTRVDESEAERRGALRRVCAFYTDTAYGATRVLDPHRQPMRPFSPEPGAHPVVPADDPAAMDWFEAEHANLLATQRAAAGHAWHAMVWQLAWSLSVFHFRRAHRHSALAVWQAALDAAAHLPDPATRTFALWRLGAACADLGRHDEAIGHLHQALALAEHDNDPAGQAHTHKALTWAWGEQRGDFRRALEHATRALELYRTVDNPSWEADTLNDLGWCAARLGEYDTARAHCQAALALHQRLHSPQGEAATVDSLGYIEHHTGHHRQAVDHHLRALALFRELNDTYRTADVLDNLGHPHAALGQHEQARAAWQQALELYRQQARTQDAERVRRQLDALG